MDASLDGGIPIVNRTVDRATRPSDLIRLFLSYLVEEQVKSITKCFGSTGVSFVDELAVLLPREETGDK